MKNKITKAMRTLLAFVLVLGIMISGLSQRVAADADTNYIRNSTFEVTGNYTLESWLMRYPSNNIRDGWYNDTGPQVLWQEQYLPIDGGLALRSYMEDGRRRTDSRNSYANQTITGLEQGKTYVVTSTVTLVKNDVTRQTVIQANLKVGNSHIYRNIIQVSTGEGTAAEGRTSTQSHTFVYTGGTVVFSLASWSAGTLDMIVHYTDLSIREVQGAPVTVNHHDEAGNAIAESITLNGALGIAYTTSPVSVFGYTLKTTPDNASGSYTQDPQTVTYIYEQTETDLAKIAAMSDLDQRAQQAKDAIDALQHISDDDKTAYKQEIETALQQGQDDVVAATSVDGVNTAVKTAQTEFDRVLTEASLISAQTDARRDLNERSEAAKEAIDALGDLSEAQKQQRKQEIDTALSDALTAVDNADDPTEASEAVDAGQTEFDRIVGEAQADNVRPALLQGLYDKAREAKQVIDGMENLTDEQKLSRKTEIDDAVAEAVSVIEQALTTEEINDAIQDGITEFDRITAKTALQDKAKDLSQRIEVMVNVPESERDQAKADIQAALAEAEGKVDSAPDQTGIALEKDRGLAAMQDIYNNIRLSGDRYLDEAKNVAQNNLQEKAAAAKAAIDAVENLSDAEKAEYKQQIDDELQAGLAAVEQADTITDVTKTVNDAVGAMDQSVTDARVADAKKAAIADLQTQADNIAKRIDLLPEVDDAEKDRVKQEITDTLNDAIVSIQDATTVSDVTTKRDEGKAALEAIEAEARQRNEAALDAAKEAAINDLNSKADAAKAAIDALNYLSNEEKQAYKDQIDDETQQTLTDIDDAITSEAVGNLLTEGKEAIDEIADNATLDNARKQAIADLEITADELKNRIDEMEELTLAEKDDAKTAINTELSKASEAVNAADDLDVVNTEKQIGIDEMNGIYDALDSTNEERLNDSKTGFVSDLEARAAEIKADLQNLSYFGNSNELQAALDAVDSALTSGETAINGSGTIAEARSARNDALRAMDTILNNAEFRNVQMGAVTSLNAKANQVNERTKQLPGVTQAEIEDVESQIAAILSQGTSNINTDTTVTDVNTERDDRRAEMEAVLAQIQATSQQRMEGARETAITELETEAQNAKDAIDGNANLNDEQKQAFKDTIDTQLEAGKEAINNAPDLDAIEMEKDHAIEDFKETIDAAREQDVRNVLEAAAEKAKQRINDLESLSQDAIAAEQSKIDAILAKGLNALENATTEPSMRILEEEALDSMDLSVAEAEVENYRQRSIQQLEVKAQEIRERVNTLPGLTSDNLAAALEEVQSTLTQAIAEVEASSEFEVILDHTVQGKEDLDAIGVKYETISENNLETAKDEAKTELEREGEDAKQRIDELDTLTPQEKQDYKDRIDEAIQEGKERIDQSESLDAVEPDKQTGSEAVEQIVNEAETEHAKREAQAELEREAETAKKVIDGLETLTPSEKETYKERIDEALGEAIETIEGQDSAAGVADAETAGSEAIETIVEEARVKEAQNKAVQELEAAGEAAKKVIDGSNALTSDAKTEAKNEVNQIVNDGIAAIRRAESVTDAEAARDEALATLDAFVNQLIADSLKNGALPGTGYSEGMRYLNALMLVAGGAMILVYDKRRNLKNH